MRRCCCIRTTASGRTRKQPSTTFQELKKKHGIDYDSRAGYQFHE